MIDIMQKTKSNLQHEIGQSDGDNEQLGIQPATCWTSIDFDK